MCNGSADSQTSESADSVDSAESAESADLLIFPNYQQYTVLITEKQKCLAASIYFVLYLCITTVQIRYHGQLNNLIVHDINDLIK